MASQAGTVYAYTGLGYLAVAGRIADWRRQGIALMKEMLLEQMARRPPPFIRPTN